MQILAVIAVEAVENMRDFGEIRDGLMVPPVSELGFLWQRVASLFLMWEKEWNLLAHFEKLVRNFGLECGRGKQGRCNAAVDESPA